MPFHSTSVCVDAAPRVKSDVALPAEPVRLTARPGTSRRTSATSRAARSSMSLRVMTVTAAGVDSTVSTTSEAVTTMRSEIFWVAAVARKRTNRKFTASSFPPKRPMKLELATAGLLASGSSFPRSLPADGSGAQSAKRGSSPDTVAGAAPRRRRGRPHRPQKTSSKKENSDAEERRGEDRHRRQRRLLRQSERRARRGLIRQGARVVRVRGLERERDAG